MLEAAQSRYASAGASWRLFTQCCFHMSLLTSCMHTGRLHGWLASRMGADLLYSVKGAAAQPLSERICFYL